MDPGGWTAEPADPKKDGRLFLSAHSCTCEGARALTWATNDRGFSENIEQVEICLGGFLLTHAAEFRPIFHIALRIPCPIHPPCVPLGEGVHTVHSLQLRR